MIEKTYDKYLAMTTNTKEELKKFIVLTPDTCSGKTRLQNHRLWMELIVSDFLYEDNTCYEIDDYDKDTLINICIVWFFDIWVKSEYYDLNDYYNLNDY